MYQFMVEGMKCGGCAAGVTRAIKTVDPIAEVTVDLAAKTVRVGSETDGVKIRKSIEAAGYSAKAAA